VAATLTGCIDAAAGSLTSRPNRTSMSLYLSVRTSGINLASGLLRNAAHMSTVTGHASADTSCAMKIRLFKRALPIFKRQFVAAGQQAYKAISMGQFYWGWRFVNNVVTFVPKTEQ